MEESNKVSLDENTSVANENIPMILRTDQIVDKDICARLPSSTATGEEDTCQTVSEMSTSFAGIAKHFHEDGYDHRENCISVQNLDGNDEFTASLITSLETIRNGVENNTTANKGKETKNYPLRLK